MNQFNNKDIFRAMAYKATTSRNPKNKFRGARREYNHAKHTYRTYLLPKKGD